MLRQLYCECEHVAYRNLSFLMYFICTPYTISIILWFGRQKICEQRFLLFPFLKFFQTSPDGNVYSDIEYVLESERLDEEGILQRGKLYGYSIEHPMRWSIGNSHNALFGIPRHTQSMMNP